MMKIIVPILILFVWKSLALYLPTYFLSLYLINLSVATELNESEQQIQQYFKLAREYRFGSVNKLKNGRKARELFETGLQRAFRNNTEIISGKRNKPFNDDVNSALLALSELLMEMDLNEVNTETYEMAFAALVRAADRGNPDAQHRLAAIYSTGVSLGGHRLVPMDSGRSLILEYMAALGGNLPAMTAMGYRYLHGVGVTESCDIALPFYEYAANAAFEYVSKLGYPTYQDRTLMSSLAETSVVNSLIELTGLSSYLKRFNLNLEFFRSGWFGRSGARKGGRQEINEEWADYYAHLAESGDTAAASALGTIYTYGSRLIAPNLQKAKHYLSIGANAKNIEACGQLGYLLAREADAMRYSSGMQEMNTSVTHNPVRIINLLTSASRKGDPNGAVGLGFVYFKGIGVEVNVSRALSYFYSKLTNHQDAGYFVGEIHMGVGDPPNKQHVNIASALQGYTVSAHMGNVLAMHKLGHMHQRGLGVSSRSCSAAAQYFRSVAERGEWAMSLNQASRLHAEGHHAAALFEYAQLAATGIEPAQFNAAYLLSQQSGASCAPLARGGGAVTSGDRLEHRLLENSSAQSIKHEHHTRGTVVAAKSSTSSNNTLVSNKAAYLSLSVPSSELTTSSELEECEVRALLLFGLSAAQNNVEALLALGDFHYYGRAALPANKAEAALYYKKAADLRHSAHAVFNLGLMHETGDGVPQDFLLAKRFYDQAAEMDSKAKIARDVAVSILEIHKSVHTALGRELVDKGVTALRFLTHEGPSAGGDSAMQLFTSIRFPSLWSRFLEFLTTTTSSISIFHDRHDEEQMIIVADEITVAVLDTLAELAGRLDPYLGKVVQEARWATERRCRRLTRLLLALRGELACLGLLGCCFGLLTFMYISRRRRRMGDGRR